MTEKFFRRFAIAAAGFVLVFGLAACEKKGPAEKAGEKIDKAVEKVGDKIEEVGDKIEDAADGTKAPDAAPDADAKPMDAPEAKPDAAKDSGTESKPVS